MSEGDDAERSGEVGRTRTGVKEREHERTLVVQLGIGTDPDPIGRDREDGEGLHRELDLEVGPLARILESQVETRTGSSHDGDVRAGSDGPGDCGARYRVDGQRAERSQGHAERAQIAPSNETLVLVSAALNARTSLKGVSGSRNSPWTDPAPPPVWFSAKRIVLMLGAEDESL